MDYGVLNPRIIQTNCILPSIPSQHEVIGPKHLTGGSLCVALICCFVFFLHWSTIKTTHTHTHARTHRQTHTHGASAAHFSPKHFHSILVTCCIIHVT